MSYFREGTDAIVIAHARDALKAGCVSMSYERQFAEALRRERILDPRFPLAGDSKRSWVAWLKERREYRDKEFGDQVVGVVIELAALSVASESRLASDTKALIQSARDKKHGFVLAVDYDGVTFGLTAADAKAALRAGQKVHDWACHWTPRWWKIAGKGFDDALESDREGVRASKRYMFKDGRSLTEHIDRRWADIAGNRRETVNLVEQVRDFVGARTTKKPVCGWNYIAEATDGRALFGSWWGDDGACLVLVRLGQMPRRDEDAFGDPRTYYVVDSDGWVVKHECVDEVPVTDDDLSFLVDVAFHLDTLNERNRARSSLPLAVASSSSSEATPRFANSVAAVSEP